MSSVIVINKNLDDYNFMTLYDYNYNYMTTFASLIISRFNAVVMMIYLRELYKILG